MRSPHEEFWRRFEAGTWEPETISLLASLLGSGTRYVDIDAWIGPTCLVAGATGASVVAFEPDPIALRYLERNIELNREDAAKIEVVPAALARKEGSAALSSAVLGDSMSSLARRRVDSVEVPTLDVRAWSRTEAFTAANVVKIDIEGFEFSLIPAMSPALRDHRPIMLLSVHASIFRERFERLPTRISLLLVRAMGTMARVRLIAALRRYEQRWVFIPRESGWRPLRGRVLWRFLLRTRGTELLLHDGAASVIPVVH